MQHITTLSRKPILLRIWHRSRNRCSCFMRPIRTSCEASLYIRTMGSCLQQSRLRRRKRRSMLRRSSGSLRQNARWKISIFQHLISKISLMMEPDVITGLFLPVAQWICQMERSQSLACFLLIWIIQVFPG